MKTSKTEKDRRDTRRLGRIATRAILMIAVVCLATSGAASAVRADDDIDGTRAALEQWIENRRLISKEKRDAALDRETIRDRIALMKRLIEARKADVAQARLDLEKLGETQKDLELRGRALGESIGFLEQRIPELENRVRTLLARLPEPVRENVEPFSQGIPENPGDTKVSLSNRYAYIAAILKELNRFNREIFTRRERRTLSDGSQVEVNALYVGLGQSYYVTDLADVAGFGTVSTEGWVWTPANDSAAEIARAIAIYKDLEGADFVRLPIRIR